MMILHISGFGDYSNSAHKQICFRLVHLETFTISYALNLYNYAYKFDIEYQPLNLIPHKFSWNRTSSRWLAG